MNISDIEDEVYNFSSVFFQDIFALVEDDLDFIENNGLSVPKKNYVIAIDYLDMVIKYFFTLDHNIAMGDTFRKLHTDVNNLYKLYKEQKDILQNIEEIFQKEFKKKSNILNAYSEEISQYKGVEDLSTEEKSDLKIILEYYKELETICFETFKRILRDDNKDTLSSLLIILNSKTYYLDELFWAEASKSDAINRLFRTQKISGEINSKNYLIYRLSVMIPYTKDYEYFKHCLRIYK